MVCNRVQRENAKLNSCLVFGLFCFVPLQKFDMASGNILPTKGKYASTFTLATAIDGLIGVHSVWSAMWS
jgi:hypothetical protein